MQFDRANADIIRKSAKYPTFLTYFNSKLMPCVRDYVNTPSRNNILRKNWSNNNCESINNIIKLDANWKPSDSKSLINLLYEITLLHFKDFRRPLYGSGNYRLHNNEARYAITKDNWRGMSETDKRQKFEDFLYNKKKAKKCTFVQSTYSKFSVPVVTIAKKPGQRKRIKLSKTSRKYV